MYSKIKIFGHPIHPILVAYPIAFYTSAFVSFVIYAFNERAFCFEFGYVSNIIGISSAAIAAIPGFIDWGIGIPAEHRAKSRGLNHMILNVLALALFTSNVLILNQNSADLSMILPILLTGAGLGCTFFAAFLGGELMQKDHIGIVLTPEQEKLEPSK